MTMFTHHQLAFETPDRIRQVQEETLAAHLKHCAENSPFYRRRFKDAGIDPAAVTLATLNQLPFTVKADLEACNDDFYAVPTEKFADIVMSSGTTGIPTKVVYSRRDLERLAYNEEKSFAACGLTAKDTVLLTCTIDRCFIAGLAYFLGITKLGAAAIRNGQNSLESHHQVMSRLRPTAVVGVPSFLKKLGLYLSEQAPEAISPVTKLVAIGEPLRGKDMDLTPLGKDLESIWQADVYSTYASSETITTFCECTAKQGGHLHPDLGVVEIVDDAGDPCPPGMPGEVVVTPLSIEAMPLIRFKTGDIGFLLDDPCPCGRHTPRLSPILGRKHQMMKVKGTTLYPPAIFNILEATPAVIDYYISIHSDHALSEDVAVHVAVNDPTVTAKHLQDVLQASLRVTPQVIIEDEKTVLGTIFSPHSRKPVRFFDRRS